MKYLSVLFFTLALAWTWNTVHSTPNIDAETHSGIQAAMARLVHSAVMNKKPQAQNFVVQKMRTEEQDNGEVRVYFQYSFSEPDGEGHPTVSKISGIATLQKSVAANDETEQWQLKKVQATNDAIEFGEGLKITPGADEPEAPTSTTPATPPPSIPAAETH